MTGVWAGETEAVHNKALARVFQQYAVPVKGQSDILIVGVPYICPYNVNSIMNPVLVQCTGLGYLFNMYRNKPLVRPGGTLIICHPLRDEFHPEHHPSYVEFFHRCLAETTTPSSWRRASKRSSPAIRPMSTCTATAMPITVYILSTCGIGASPAASTWAG